MLAAVCVDYCLEIRRVDHLYGPAFESFVKAGQVGGWVVECATVCT